MNESSRIDRPPRQRLVELLSALDSAPFNVSGLRRDLGRVHSLPEAEARTMLKRTLAQLRHSQWKLAQSDAKRMPPAVLAKRQNAVDWLQGARSILLDHALN